MGLLGRILRGMLVLHTLAAPIWAHSFNPAFLRIDELPGSRLNVIWKFGTSSENPNALSVSLPDSCFPIGSPRISVGSGSHLENWKLDCRGKSLTGMRVGVKGLDTSTQEVLLRIGLQDGRSFTQIFKGMNSFFIIPQKASSLEVLKSYLCVGIEHILLGYDHLLFVLGLILLVKGRRRLLITISAFTLSHSLTLTLATLHILNLPSRPVEATIALSIVLLALEATRKNQETSWTVQYPWAVAFLFGLLHGLGFAGALNEIGLPTTDIPLALVGFSFGVEIGQWTFVLFILTLVPVFRRLSLRLAYRGRDWGRQAVTYSIGSISVFWLLDRVAAFWQTT